MHWLINNYNKKYMSAYKHRPSSDRQGNVIQMAFPWRSDGGLSLFAGWVASLKSGSVWIQLSHASLTR